MKTVRLLGRSFAWMVIIGLSSGIFGVMYSIARIADFYLKEGAAVQTQTILNVISSDEKALLKAAISDLKNIEGVRDAYPYFSPQGTVLGAIEYFGFKESMPVKIQGIPTELGKKSVSGAYQQDWSSITGNKIPVLIPKRAVDLYNNAAPGRGWPSLPQETFLGLPGLSLTFDTNKFEAVIVGFDNDEVGFTLSVPAEKLYSVYEELGLSPEYNSIALTALEGLNKEALANMRQSIQLQGYTLETGNTESLQVRILNRVRFGLWSIGLFFFLGALALKTLFSVQYFNSYLGYESLLKLWGIRSNLVPVHVTLSLFFGIACTLLSWSFCFFFIIPAQQPLIDNLSTFGLNLPPLEMSADSAIRIASVSGLLYIITDIGNILLFRFYYLTRRKFFR